MDSLKGNMCNCNVIRFLLTVYLREREYSHTQKTTAFVNGKYNYEPITHHQDPTISPPCIVAGMVTGWQAIAYTWGWVKYPLTGPMSVMLLC